MTTNNLLPQRATARLRIREGAPATASPRVGYVEVGTVFEPEAMVEGESVMGNASWYALPANRFVWSGASEAVENSAPISPAADMRVNRRPDGTIMVLSTRERQNVFGTFGYAEVQPRGAIRIDPAWVRSNIEEIATPVLAAVGYPRLSVHRKAAGPFQRVLDKIADAGLEDRIKTCAGTWVARHMGWDPTRALSSHSWGAAIDLNARWNGYGAAPAPMGATGSVRELVPIFESEGFAWGGYFRPDSLRDGMHFELSRLDL
jgi:hypothetical protein